MKIYIVVLATLFIFGMFVKAVPEYRRDIKKAKIAAAPPVAARYVRADVEEMEGRGGKIEEMRKLAEKRFARDEFGKRKLMDRMHRSIEESCDGPDCDINH